LCTKEVQLECGYRIDILVEDQIILELKAVDALLAVHTAQILTYMKLARKSLGLLMNFNVPLLKKGLRRFVL
jgi:GxxExxY protein